MSGAMSLLLLDDFVACTGITLRLPFFFFQNIRSVFVKMSIVHLECWCTGSSGQRIYGITVLLLGWNQ